MDVSISKGGGYRTGMAPPSVVFGLRPTGLRPTISWRCCMKIVIDTDAKVAREFVKETGEVVPWKEYTVLVNGEEVKISGGKMKELFAAIVSKNGL